MLAQVQTDALGVFPESLAHQDFYIGERSSAADRVTAIGRDLREFSTCCWIAEERIKYFGVDGAGAQGQVAAGYALGQGYNIGFDAPVFGGEEFTGAAEAGDDFVENEQDPVAVADLSEAGQVFVGRDNDAAAADDRRDCPLPLGT